jgi:hypothetical protein
MIRSGVRLAMISDGGTRGRWWRPVGITIGVLLATLWLSYYFDKKYTPTSPPLASSATPKSNANPAPSVITPTAPKNQAPTSPSPPPDFRGVKWGSSPAQWMQKVGGPYGPDKLSTWKNPKKLPPFVNVPVAEEGYLFQNNMLFGGEMFIDGAENFTTLKASLITALGTPSSAGTIRRFS